MLLSVELVLVSVCLLFTFSVQAEESLGTLSKKHEHLISTLRDYHLVRPYRSTPNGDFMTHDLSTEYENDRFDFHRIRRAAESSRKRAEGGRMRRETAQDLESEADEQTVLHYSMHVFGARITINVTRAGDMVAPSFKVNRYMSDGSIITERPKMNCFYRGTVIGANSSAVAVSNCHGVSGWIKADEEEYFIEPLETADPQSSTYNYTDGFVHIMYRRRDIDTTNEEYHHSPGRIDLHHDVVRLGARHRQRAARLASAPSRRRTRRMATNERQYYVETMVTFDFGVHSFHGTDNIALYLLTLMNIVNTVYTHPSLDAKIEFVVTRANLLDEEMSSQLVVTNDSMSSLSNTCRFARAQRRMIFDDGSHDYFDHSAFITRTVFGPAGYAPVGYMCHISHSCSLTKDDGIQSAFVLAHETGHVLGLEHDGDGNQCFDDAEGMSIMATIVTATPKGHYWSECSKQELHQNLPLWTCLHDVPSAAAVRAVNNSRPGRPYSMDDQCRFQFGPAFRKCHHDDVDFCLELYCAGPGLDGGCLKKGPPMDGTKCGKQRECVQEVCVAAKPLDGGWGPWGPWGLCSYSCGLGVQSRRRACNNPPPDGGNDCSGAREMHRLCNMQVCPDGPIDKHGEQCKQEGKRLDMPLLAYQSPDPLEACQLSCMSEETGEVTLFNDYVIDGTPASYDYPELICINGRVQSVGCDLELGSTRFWDNCGVCDGRNATCLEIITDAIDAAPTQKKYKKIMTLTPGMWNLKVTKSVLSSHFLALKIEENGKYILNRGKKQSPSHAFIESGVRFVYTTDGENETLTAKGPIPFVLFLMVFGAKDDRPVNYKVELYEDYGDELPDAGVVDDNQLAAEEAPVDEVTVSPDEPVVEAGYIWEDLGWTECTADCDGGYSYHRHQCTRLRDDRKVKYRLCGRRDYDPKAERVRCNEHPCPTEPTVFTYEWQTTAWSECSSTCGASAVRTREVQCFQIANNVQTPVDPESCSAASRAHDTEPCGLEPCASNWAKGAWSECSATCGPGVKTREVTCQVPEGALDVDYQCRGLEPPSTKKCEKDPCPQTSCQKMESIICDTDRFEMYCNMPGYSKICCTTCEELRAQMGAP